MRTEPLSYDNESPIGEPVGKVAGIARRIDIRLFHEVLEALPLTILRLQFHRAHDDSPWIPSALTCLIVCRPPPEAGQNYGIPRKA